MTNGAFNDRPDIGITAVDVLRPVVRQNDNANYLKPDAPYFFIDQQSFARFDPVPFFHVKPSQISRIM